MTDKYKIARYGDRKWIDLFVQAINEGIISSATFNGVTGINPQNVTNPDELHELLQFFHKEDSVLLNSVSTDIQGLNITFVRMQDSSLYDELQFSWNQKYHQKLSDEDRAKIISWFTSKVLKFDPERGLLSGTDVSEIASNELALHNSILERLTELQKELAESTVMFNRTIQENYLEEKQRLDEQLAEEREKLKKDFEERNLTLDKREAEIDALDNTAARRKIKRDLLEELDRRSKKFELTKRTNTLRRPVNMAFLGLITILIYALVLVSAITYNQPGDSYIFYHFLQISGLTLSLIGTFIFYIRWLIRWFEQHAQAEFKSKQFQLDIERASWLVETALEWNGSEGEELPKELLESISRNLFSSYEKNTDQVKHPADELASALLGSASNVRLNLGGNEIELDGKKLKKAKIKK